MKKVAIPFLFAVAAFPAATAWWFDGDFSSGAHVPAIGVAGIAVTLCDALFGQIVALTRDLPFQYGQTPAETDEAIERAEAFHFHIFGAWILAKLSSAFAVILPAITIAPNAGAVIEQHRKWILLAGYIALGVAFSSAVFFFSTYAKARRAAAKARRREISKRYDEEHEPHNTPEAEEQERVINAALEGYNSKPEIIG